MNKYDAWEKWADFYDDEYAQKRIKSAKSAKLTPVSIDEENLCGVFTGSHGRYLTSLEGCPCGDFRRAKRPCKHMYRLAMELGLLDVTYKSDSSQRVLSKKESATFEESIFLIESFSEELQRYLLDALFDLLYHSKNGYACVEKNNLFEELISSGLAEEKMDFYTFLNNFKRNQINEKISNLDLNIEFKKNMRLDKLIAWCIENIPEQIPELFPDYTTIVFSLKYKNNCSKIYKYLHRLYGVEQTFDEDLTPSEIPIIQTILPDDAATELLIKNGHYDPNNIKYHFQV